MAIKCAHCGNDFEPKRSDAKFCSPACKQAAHRLQNLMLNGTIIRGQHENDVPPTARGIETAVCRSCQRHFPRWIESKLARLVRNELEGSTDWGPRNDLDLARFTQLMDARKEEVRFCSPECQGVGELPHELKVRPEKPRGKENEEKEELERKESRKTPKRRGS